MNDVNLATAMHQLSKRGEMISVDPATFENLLETIHNRAPRLHFWRRVRGFKHVSQLDAEMDNCWRSPKAVEYLENRRSFSGSCASIIAWCCAGLEVGASEKVICDDASKPSRSRPVRCSGNPYSQC